MATIDLTQYSVLPILPDDKDNEHLREQMMERLLDKEAEHPAWNKARDPDGSGLKEAAKQLLQEVFLEDELRSKIQDILAWQLIKNDDPETMLSLQIYSWHPMFYKEEKGAGFYKQMLQDLDKEHLYKRKDDGHRFFNLPKTLRGTGLGDKLMAHSMRIVLEQHNAPILATIATEDGHGVFNKYHYYQIPHQPEKELRYYWCEKEEITIFTLNDLERGETNVVTELRPPY
ncbi:MAG: hypothetical protein Q9162_006431 [Coniocarpon cinnabarinum]